MRKLSTIAVALLCASIHAQADTYQVRIPARVALPVDAGTQEPPPALEISIDLEGATLEDGSIGVQYSADLSRFLSISGGGYNLSDVTFSVAQGDALPPGMAISGATLSGVPATPGVFDFGLTALYALKSASARYQLSVPVPSAFFAAMNGEPGSSQFTSADGAALSTLGNPRHANAQFKSGPSSAYFDGDSDAILVPGAKINVGSKDFVIELWYYPINTARIATFLRGENGGGGGSGLDINHDSQKIKFDLNGGTIPIANAPISALTSGAWNKLRFSRSGSVWKININDQDVSTGTYSGAVALPNQYRIGGNSYSATYSAYGYIDDFRVTILTPQ